MRGSATRVTRNIYRAIAQESNSVGQQFHRATCRIGVTAASVNLSRANDTATAANQADYAAGVVDPLCADDPFIINDVREDVPRRTSREQHLSARSLDLSRVADGGIEHAGVFQDLTRDLEEQQAIAVKIERRAAAGGQCHLAEFSDDQTLVADAAAQQRD